MDTRREPRTSQNERVHIFGLDPAGKPINLDTYTVDISYHGARLRDVHVWPAPGETVGVRRGPEKARFKIIWVGKPGTASAGQVGLSSLDYDKLIWDATPVESAAGATAARGRAASSGPQLIPRNRRKYDRYRAPSTATVTAVPAGTDRPPMTVSGVLRDLSLGGCFAETLTPLFDGTRVNIAVRVGDVTIEAQGHVALYRRLVGMGVQFDEVPDGSRGRLEELVAQLSRTQPAA